MRSIGQAVMEKIEFMLKKVKEKYGKPLKKREKMWKKLKKLAKKLRKIGYEVEFEEVEGEGGEVMFELRLKNLKTKAFATIEVSKAELLSRTEFKWYIDEDAYDLIIKALHILEEAFSTSLDDWMREELVRTITSDSVFPKIFLPNTSSWEAYLLYVKGCLELGFNVDGYEVLYSDEAFRRMVKEYRPAPNMLGRLVREEEDLFVFREAVLEYLPEGCKSIYLIRAKNEFQREDLLLIVRELCMESHRPDIYDALVKRYYNRGMPKNLQEIFLKHFIHEADDLDCLNFLTVYKRVCGDHNFYLKTIEPIIKACLSKLLGLYEEFTISVLRDYFIVSLRDRKGKPAILFHANVDSKSYEAEIMAVGIIRGRFMGTAPYHIKGAVISTLDMYLPKRRLGDIWLLKEYVKLSCEYCEKLADLEKLVYRAMGKSFSILLYLSKTSLKLVFPNIHLSYYAGNWESQDTLETFRDIVENLDNHVTIILSGKKYTLREFSEKFSKIAGSS